MPQMAPMAWTMMLFLFYSIIIVLLSKLYYFSFFGQEEFNNLSFGPMKYLW